MKRSSDRILTTHVGSLIRPQELQDQLAAREVGEPFSSTHRKLLTESVRDVVRQQNDVGVDVVSDGEFGKPLGWSMYALDRLTGFEPRVQPPEDSVAVRSEDRRRFAEFYASGVAGLAGGAQGVDQVCVGPVSYVGLEALREDIRNFKAALEGV